MYIFFIVLIVIASLLLIITVLVQNPKSGMAANFGASNQVMGVRQTTDFLEKATWGLSLSILILSLLATMAMPTEKVSASRSGVEKALMEEMEASETVIPNQIALPAAEESAPAAEKSAPATGEESK